jgi:hypothetical protein
MLIIIIIYKLKVNKINENLFKTTKYMWNVYQKTLKKKLKKNWGNE